MRQVISYLYCYLLLFFYFCVKENTKSLTLSTLGCRNLCRHRDGNFSHFRRVYFNLRPGFIFSLKLNYLMCNIIMPIHQNMFSKKTLKYSHDIDGNFICIVHIVCIFFQKKCYILFLNVHDLMCSLNACYKKLHHILKKQNHFDKDKVLIHTI